MPPMMGIVGLGRQLQRLGNIKMGFKGEEKKKRDGSGTYRLPQKLDHFIVTTMEQDENGDWVPDEAIMEILGPKPTSIPVFVPYHDDMEIFPREYAWWRSSRRECHGNGEISERFNPDTNEYDPGSCPCEHYNNADPQKRVCKKNGILNVMLEISGRIGGVHQLRTASGYSIQNIVNSLGLLQSLTGGPLAGIPLTLTIQKMKVHPKGLPQQVTIYVAGLEFRADLNLGITAVEQLQLKAGNIIQAQLAGGKDMQMLGSAESTGKLLGDTEEDALNWEQEFAATAEEKEIDQKTTSKTAGMRKRLKESEAKAAKEAETAAAKKAAADDAQAAQVRADKEAKDAEAAAKPTVAETKENIRTEMDTLMKSEFLPRAVTLKIETWLKEKKLSVAALEAGLAKLIKKIEQYEAMASDSATDKPPPALTDLDTQILDLMGQAREDGVVTEEEHSAVFDETDKLETPQALMDLLEKWKKIIGGRRSVRAEEIKQSTGK